MTSPSYTSLFSLIRNPIARRKFSIRISVFFTSEEYTSDPTIGQNGTLVPNSCAMPSASAVFPVPGAPAIKSALPAIFFPLIISTTIPQASRACSCPTHPALSSIASPDSCRPRPCGVLRCWGGVSYRESRVSAEQGAYVLESDDDSARSTRVRNPHHVGAPPAARS